MSTKKQIKPCKDPRARIGDLLKDGVNKKCAIPCDIMKRPDKSKRCQKDMIDPNKKNELTKLLKRIKEAEKQMNIEGQKEKELMKEVRAYKKGQKGINKKKEEHQEQRNKLNKAMTNYRDLEKRKDEMFNSVMMREYL